MFECLIGRRFKGFRGSVRNRGRLPIVAPPSDSLSTTKYTKYTKEAVAKPPAHLVGPRSPRGRKGNTDARERVPPALPFYGRAALLRGRNGKPGDNRRGRNHRGFAITPLSSLVSFSRGVAATDPHPLRLLPSPSAPPTLTVANSEGEGLFRGLGGLGSLGV